MPPPSSNGASGCGWRPPGGSPAAARSARSPVSCGLPKASGSFHGRIRVAGLARGRRRGAPVEGAGVAGVAEPAAAGPAGSRAAVGAAGAPVPGARGTPATRQPGHRHTPALKSRSINGHHADQPQPSAPMKDQARRSSSAAARHALQSTSGPLR
jgi:hypothetical protein